MSTTTRPTNPYLFFCEEWPPDRKTAVVEVRSTKDVFLGHIKWFGRWRQYAFFPGAETIWNVGCLETVEEYISSLMRQRGSNGQS
jgi:hypothetical protein